ncbi:hypothetical protein NW868_08580 [Synechococcus sp. R60.2]|uniref:hypothetical protein n=1 Tax=Synechococcus sp. W55.2 TaxID=2964513 RepID=UPI0039C3789A
MPSRIEVPPSVLEQGQQQGSLRCKGSPQVSSRKHFMTLVEETHRRNLLHRLQERIRSAQARGDEHLLQQLEQERQLLA